MKQNRNVLSFLLPTSLFAILGVVACFQFKWVKDLQEQEQWRLEALLTKSTIRLADTIQEELVLLPSLVKTRENQPKAVEERIITGIEFWNTHASVPELFSSIYMITRGDTPYVGVWNGSEFTVPDETVKNDIERVLVPVFIEETDSIISLYLTLPDGRSLIVASVSITSPDYYLVTEINASVFTNIQMPAIAEDIFPQSDSYRFRIIDLYTGKTIYASEKNYSDKTFAKPDFSWPLPALSTFKSQAPVPAGTGFSIERFPENPQQIFSILRAYSRKKPVGEQDRAAEHLAGVPGPQNMFPENERTQFILEVVHKDGSLLKASRKATAVNAVTSLGVIVLLGFGLAVLIHNLRKAQNLAESQQEFIATITHELKTPLAVISSAAQNLAAGIITNEEKVKKYGTMIEKENIRLRNSIEYFLLYSNINTLTRLNCTDCDLVQIITDVLAGNEMLRTKLEFVTEISMPDCPVCIRCDRAAFYSVIQNMVSNVLKHARDGKYLGISLSVELADSSRYKKHGYRIVNQKTHPAGRKSGDLCRVAVLKISDHGNDIPRNEQKNVF